MDASLFAFLSPDVCPVFHLIFRIFKEFMRENSKSADNIVDTASGFYRALNRQILHYHFSGMLCNVCINLSENKVIQKVIKRF